MTSPDLPGLEAVLERAHAALRVTRTASEKTRAEWLDAIADALDASADDLVPIAMRESRLPEPRLRGELVRTAFQARLFARRLREGGLFDLRIDHADPEWPMGPRPDIRRGYRPIGVVLVFAASNFPFAFSVAGGDAVSALAAGCPVVVKVHEGHPELSRAVGTAVRRALADAGAPEGVLGLVEGQEAGAAATLDPRVKAVGFTGSTRGGRALFDLAVGREDPIPFYGELGSTNPVFVTPAGWDERGAQIASGFAGSFTLGSGQFCTKPGIVFAPDPDAFVARVAEALDGAVGPMLGERIQDGFLAAVDGLADAPGVSVAWHGSPNDDGVSPVLLRAGLDDVIADPRLLEHECFGPAALVVGYDAADDALRALDGVRGSLTTTIQAASGADPVATAAVARAAEYSGRVIWNDWPTGVTVSDAQQHGGPWPATAAPTTTSVGTAAATRFVRPVAYQGVPADALPNGLRDADERPGRLVDGVAEH